MLTRLGLGRPELRAWAAYDWANSAFYTVIVTAVYPVFFQRVAAADLPPAQATQHHATATFVALALVAVMSPLLGALADQIGAKKKLLAVFAALGAAATAGLATIDEGEWLLAAGLFVLANVGIVGSVVFYDSLLPHIAADEELDRVSTAGFAVGYVGGGLMLAFSLLLIQQPALFGLRDGLVATQLGFLAVALWWLLFTIPLLRVVPEPPVVGGTWSGSGHALRQAYRRLLGTFCELRRYREAFWLLLAVMFYSDGIGTIIRMATIYGAELGLPDSALIGSILMVQFVGMPFAFLFGALARRFGTRPALLCGLLVYVGITVFGATIDSALDFFVLAFLVATVQGGTQALSRSLFAQLIPRRKSAEFFGFFAIFEKFAGTFGPLLVAVLIAWTGTTRYAVLAIAVFFLAGIALLLKVDVQAGMRAARAAPEDQPPR